MVITIANTTKRVKANTLNAPAHSIGSPKRLFRSVQQVVALIIGKTIFSQRAK